MIHNSAITPLRAGGCQSAGWIEVQSPRRSSRSFRCFILACAAGFMPYFHSPTACADDKKVTYDDQLSPIFRQRCSACHNPTAKKADLDVTNYLSLMHGGSSGSVIEP